MSKIGIVVEFEAKPGAEAAFERLIREHATTTLETEPGCLRFEVLHVYDADDKPLPGRFMVIELYVDMAAVQQHRAMPRLAKVRDAFGPLLANRRLIMGEIVE
jgi:autoinducer 2-degrading protein